MRFEVYDRAVSRKYVKLATACYLTIQDNYTPAIVP